MKLHKTIEGKLFTNFLAMSVDGEELRIDIFPSSNSDKGFQLLIRGYEYAIIIEDFEDPFNALKCADARIKSTNWKCLNLDDECLIPRFRLLRRGIPPPYLYENEDQIAVIPEDPYTEAP